jgi:hypothetical protein
MLSVISQPLYNFIKGDGACRDMDKSSSILGLKELSPDL